MMWGRSAAEFTLIIKIVPELSNIYYRYFGIYKRTEGMAWIWGNGTYAGKFHLMSNFIGIISVYVTFLFQFMGNIIM